MSMFVARKTRDSHQLYEREEVLNKTRIKWGQSLFAFMSGLFLLFILSSPVLAATPEIEAIREQIRIKGALWQSEETSITKLPQELRLKRLGLLKGPLSATEGAHLLRSIPSVAQDSTYLNYNEPPNDYVTPIKDQGNCGSCWAFSTTAALESQVLMATRADPASIDLAEQILLSCSGAGNCEQGGQIDLASDFFKSTGLPPESCFPYTATDNQCSNATCPSWQSDTATITGWQWVTTTSPTVDVLKNALLTYGPLVTTMNVYEDLFSYAGGVYSYVSGRLEGSHAIEIIGYDDSNQCFIVKNSWGAGWGESEAGSISTRGFFRIAYSELDDPNVQFGYFTIAYAGSNHLSVPGPPTGVIATPGNAQAAVGFTPPASNGGSAITGYTVTSIPGGGIDLNARTTSTTHTVGGLTDGTAYTFTVRATNTMFAGPASGPSNQVTPGIVPGAPTNVTATPGNAQATVNFQLPTTGTRPITSCTVTPSPNPSGITATGAGSPVTVTGLTNGAAYNFTATAANATGTGPPSSPSKSVMPAGPPGAPTVATVTPGNSQATVSFTTPANDGSSITGYTVTSSPSQKKASGPRSPITVKGLTNGTAYTFTITAANKVGTGPVSGPSGSVTPGTVPGAPTGVTATPANAQATVSFTTPASNGGSAINDYTVTSLPGGKTASGTGPTLTVTGLTKGTAYTFTVKATNAMGTGPASKPSNKVKVQ
jgi:C1A family cysteine protease